MKQIRYLLKTLDRLQKDESGNMAMIFGSMFVILIAIMGAGYDMTQLTSAKHKASSIADQSALASAIYFTTHGEKPESNSEGFVDGQEYKAADLAYKFDSLSTHSARDVKIKVTYDTTNKEAKAEVYGYTEPAFMQVFGYKKLDFKTVAVAKFKETQLKDPASIALVLDNSGSMNFMDERNVPNTESGTTPSGAQPRITGLTSSVDSFMDQLYNVIGDQTSDENKALRIAMYPYASTGYFKTQREFTWEVTDRPSGSFISSMNPDGGTDPVAVLTKAYNNLKNDPISIIDEPSIHENMHGDGNPLRYVIFMTDGQNNGELNTWDPRSGTDVWGRDEPVYETRYRWEDQGQYETVTTEEECDYQINYRDTWYDVSEYWYGRYTSWGYEGQEVNCRGGGTEEVWVSNWVEVPYQHQTGTNFVTVASEFQPPANGGNEWEEGIHDSALNIQTRAICKDMADEGIEVFTIAYALEGGWYDTGAWSGSADDYEIPVEKTLIAKSLMQYCATSPENFVDAANTEALTKAFNKIGTDIIEEVIRLSM